MSRKIESALKRSAVFGRGRSGGTLLAAAGCLALSCACLTAQTNTGSSVDQELEQMRLMRIREEAQKSRPDAQAAQLENAAEQALVQQQDNRALNEARAIREAKERAVRDAKMRQAANAYQGVSSSQIQTWNDQNTGAVKVQRNVPMEVQSELYAQEQERRKIEGDPNEKKGGLLRAPGRALKGVFGKDDEEAASPGVVEEEKKRDGFLSRLKKEEEPAGLTAGPTDEKEGFLKRMIPGGGEREEEPLADSRTGEEKEGLLHRMGEKLPFAKKKDDEPKPIMPTFAPVNSLSATQPTVAPANTGVEPPEPERQGFLNRVGSNLPLIGRGKKDEEIASTSPPSPGMFGPAGTPAPMVSASDSVPEHEKKGLFGRIGKNKEAEAASSSLFPTSSDDALLAEGNNDRGGGIGKFIPKLPKIGEMSLPKIGGGDKPTPLVDNTPTPDPKLKGVTKGTTHAGGSDLYVVKEQTTFMQFGADALSSQSVTLTPGTVVRMTKPGDEWCSVQMSSGAEGVVPNSVLKPASAAESAGMSFASPSRPTGPTHAPVTQTSGSFVGPATSKPAPAPVAQTPAPVASRPARITSTVSAAQNEVEAGNSLPAIGIPATTDPLSGLPGASPATSGTGAPETLALP